MASLPIFAQRRRSPKRANALLRMQQVQLRQRRVFAASAKLTLTFTTQVLVSIVAKTTLGSMADKRYRR